MEIETIRWHGDRDGCVRLIEQTLLPGEARVLEVRTVEGMRDAIARLAVRGAPAIGVATAFGIVLGARGLARESPGEVVAAARAASDLLVAARPTAVNLSWAARRMVARAERDRDRGLGGEAIVEGLLAEAQSIRAEDAAVCERLGEIGAGLLRDGWTVLTHCNAGALATAGQGTALAPVYRARAQGKRVAVIAGETRPLLQGSRLTAWELSRAGVDVTLITDSTAGRVMFEGRVDAVLVGADRIARNGDVCNKIGTYTVALLAREHKIPFYVVAPLSTFDPALADGGGIPIEQRPAAEVTHGFGRRTAPEGVKVYNPAFDVTPARLVTAIVTEVGLIESPDRERVEAALRRGGRLLD